MQLGLSQSKASIADASAMSTAELNQELLAGRRELLAAVRDEIRFGTQPDQVELRLLREWVLNLANEHRRRFPPPPPSVVTGVRRRRARRSEN